MSAETYSVDSGGADMLVLISGLSAVLWVAGKRPEMLERMGIRVVTKSAPISDAAKEGKKTDCNLFGNGDVAQVGGVSGQKAGTTNHSKKGEVAVKASGCVGRFGDLPFFNFCGLPSLNKWVGSINQWSECGNDFFVVGGDGFDFLVRNNWLGRWSGFVFAHMQSRWVKKAQSTGAAA